MRRNVLTLATFCTLLIGACNASPAPSDTPADGGATDAVAAQDCAALDWGGPDAPPPLPDGAFLTSNEAWGLVPPDADPWWASRAPEKVPCTAADIAVEDSPGAEGTWLSVSTESCGYATLSQTLLQDIPACTALVVHIWYFKFLPPKETAGVGYEVALTIGDDAPAEPLLRLAADQLPPESGLIYEVVQTKRAYTAGETVHFHVSNHGSNSWEFIQLRAIE